jgi:hypothetical protein
MISVKVTAKGFKETKKAFEIMRDQFVDAVEEVMREYIELELLDRIKVNTPIATGELRESIKLARVDKRSDLVSFVIEADKPYALRVHEGEFRLGARSREQPPQPEGGVGNKYITRVVNYHADDLLDIMGNLPTVIIRKMFPSGVTRTIRSVQTRGAWRLRRKKQE